MLSNINSEDFSFFLSLFFFFLNSSSVIAGCNRCNYHDGVSSLVFDKFKWRFKFTPLAASVFISPGGMQMFSPEGTAGTHSRWSLCFISQQGRAALLEDLPVFVWFCFLCRFRHSCHSKWFCAPVMPLRALSLAESSGSGLADIMCVYSHLFSSPPRFLLPLLFLSEGVPVPHSSHYPQKSKV